MDPLNKIPAKNKNITWKLICKEALAITAQDQEAKVIVFNEIGSVILESVDGKNSVGSIIEKIVDDYEVEHEKARSEVTDFLHELSKENLIYFQD